jgi:hypothetical protein
MKIVHTHPDYLPEQRKALLLEAHHSCRAELLRNLARQMGELTPSIPSQSMLKR